MEAVAEKYKMTEVGLIPSDWEVKNIGSICQIFGRIGFRGYTVNDIVAKEQGAITISPSNIQGDKMDFSKCTYLSWFKYEESPEIKIFNGDVLLVKTGSTSGKTAIVKNLNEKATINPQLVVLKKIKTDNFFLSYIMSFGGVQNQIISTIVGGAIPTLSQKQVLSFKIPVPPTKAEQTAIATALSDADALISSLEKLIAKKRNIKQGAMQQLLIDNCQLSIDNGGWEVKKLGEVFTFYSTANYSKAEMTYDGEIGCMHYGLVHAIPNMTYSLENGVKFYVQGDKTKYELIKDGDIIMVDASEDLLGINKSVEVFGVGNKKFISGLHTYLMRDENSVLLNNFRGRILNSSIVKNQLVKLAVGMKVFGVSKAQLKEVLIPFPPHKEQTRIATILSDMDAEIAALQTKLEKYKKVKLGMMQNLLTGKIRLV